MGQGQKTSRNWRELLITPLIEAFLVLGSFLGAIEFHRKTQQSFFLDFLVFYGMLVVLTVLSLWFIRLGLKIDRGIYSYETTPWIFYFWKLHSFLCSTNLGWAYLNGLLPPVLRKYFYQLLGARIGSGFISISGRILDPYLVTIHQAARVGDDALIMPHGYAVGSSDLLILERIELMSGSFVGARTTLMPGVVIGENSMVKSMSVVVMNTKIPPNEIWGGNPAKKIADIDKPLEEAL